VPLCVCMFRVGVCGSGRVKAWLKLGVGGITDYDWGLGSG